MILHLSRKFPYFALRRSAAGAAIASAAGYAGVMGASGGTLGVSAAYACVRLLADSVACLPLGIMRNFGERYGESRADDNLRYLLNVAPNAACTAYDFKRELVTALLLEGNAYVLPVYADGLNLSALYLCGVGTVAHNTFADTYTVRDLRQGLSGVYGADEIIHVKMFPSPYDRKAGVSVVANARLTLDIAKAGDREAHTLFATGGTQRGFLSNDTSVRGMGKYQSEALESTAVDLEKRANSKRYIIPLPGEVRYTPWSLSPADMQFLENRKFTVAEVCRFFGVHPSFVFADTSGNYKDAENASAIFLSHTLNPLLCNIEAELLRKLVPDEYAMRTRIEFDRRAMYATDLNKRVQYQAASIAAGLYTPNEWRRIENRAPAEGGDTLFISANLRPLNQKENEQE